MAEKCEHKSRETLEKKVLDVEEIPAAYCATVTKTTCQMLMNAKTVAISGPRPKRKRSLIRLLFQRDKSVSLHFVF